MEIGGVQETEFGGDRTSTGDWFGEDRGSTGD